MKDCILWLAFLMIVLIVFPVVFYIFSNNVNFNSDGDIITLYDHKSKMMHKIELEEYLVGVVSAEMPAVFSEEALKAQSVAARTYAMKKINSGTDAHPQAELCTDYAHCQAYVSPEEQKEKWGSDYGKNMSKIKKSVYSTKGEYLSYNGEVAVAVFHSCSNGITEKASDVWGGDVPYLTNVPSEGDFERDDYCSKKELTVEEFVQTVSQFCGKELSDIEELMGDIKYTSGENVASIKLCDIEFSGVDVRKMFGLRSTAFDISFVDDKVIFDVYGNGHGVGMSQYGADSMAKKGKTYALILSHYYPGTELKKQ